MTTETTTTLPADIVAYRSAPGNGMVKGDVGALTRTGVVALSGSLVAGFDVKTYPYVRLYYSASARQLWLEPMTTNEPDGVLSWAIREGLMLRCAAVRAMRDWGLIPAKTVHLPARREGQYFVIELGPAKEPKPKPDSGLACGSCKHRKHKACMNVSAPSHRRHKLVGVKTEACEAYVANKGSE